MWFRHNLSPLVAIVISFFVLLQMVECDSSGMASTFASSLRTSSDLTIYCVVGLRFSTAAAFSGSSAIALGRRAGSQSYREFMAASINHDMLSKMDLNQIQTMLVEELESIRSLARELANDDLHIGTISYPPHFQSRTQWDLIWDAVQTLEPEFGDSPVRMRPDYIATAYTYPPSGCLESAYDYWGVRTEDEVLLFDYFFQQQHIYDLDVDTLAVGCNVNGTLLPPNNRTALREILLEPSNFINQSNIAAVILSSDDPAHDYAELEKILQNDFPVLASKLQIRSTGFEYTHAVGAACIARQIVAHPKAIEPLDLPFALPDDHDEL